MHDLMNQSTTDNSKYTTDNAW